MKRTVTNGILVKVAMGLESEDGARLNYSIPERVIPEIKTIPEYECALDKAAEDFFLYGSDDDILAILQDAKKHQIVPREYKSVDIRNFDTNGVSIRKASIKYNTECKVSINIYFTFGSVKITANKVVISGKPKLTSNLCKLIEACQDTIGKIQKALRS